MASPIALPVARLRAAGCKVGNIIGHDPCTTGSHPKGRPNWHYGITPPEGSKALRYAIGAPGTREGRAVASWHWTGKVEVYAQAPAPPHDGDRATIKADRLRVEADVAKLLTRLADIQEGTS